MVQHTGGSNAVWWWKPTKSPTRICSVVLGRYPCGHFLLSELVVMSCIGNTWLKKEKEKGQQKDAKT
uniref:Uncharacterized protein n=1 Tax=Bracon brevicornis TaxID=1563983 RepID=A0A6V7KXJ3_9HYME